MRRNIGSLNKRFSILGLWAQRTFPYSSFLVHVWDIRFDIFVYLVNQLKSCKSNFQCASPSFIIELELDHNKFNQQKIKHKLTKIISCVSSCRTLSVWTVWMKTGTSLTCFSSSSSLLRGPPTGCWRWWPWSNRNPSSRSLLSHFKPSRVWWCDLEWDVCSAGENTGGRIGVLIQYNTHDNYHTSEPIRARVFFYWS